MGADRLMSYLFHAMRWPREIKGSTSSSFPRGLSTTRAAAPPADRPQEEMIELRHYSIMPGKFAEFLKLASDVKVRGLSSRRVPCLSLPD